MNSFKVAVPRARRAHAQIIYIRYIYKNSLKRSGVPVTSNEGRGHSDIYKAVALSCDCHHTKFGENLFMNFLKQANIVVFYTITQVGFSALVFIVQN